MKDQSNSLSVTTALLVLSAAGAFFFAAPAAAVGAGTDSLSFKGALPPTRAARAGWGRDIFAPLASVAAPSDLRLTAVIYNRVRPSAIINNAIVYIGSTVSGQKVVDIGKTHVILQGVSGTTIRLELSDAPEPPDGVNKE